MVSLWRNAVSRDWIPDTTCLYTYEIFIRGGVSFRYCSCLLAFF
jgi:hypothetical protein